MTNDEKRVDFPIGENVREDKRGTPRGRLVELLVEASSEAGKHFRETTKKVLAEKGRFNSKEDIDRRNIYEIEADYLLANGVIVPPCKIGDTVYTRYGYSFVVERIEIFDDKMLFRCGNIGTDDYMVFYADEIGTEVFFTEEEAEKALKEGVQG